MKSKKQETPVKNRRLDGYAVVYRLLIPDFFSDIVFFVIFWKAYEGGISFRIYFDYFKYSYL